MAAAEDALRELRELVRAARYREALELFDRTATRDAPTDPEAELVVAAAATRIGRIDRAAELAGRALEQFLARANIDGQMRAANLLGAIAFERGELDEAERTFSEALELARQLSDTLVAARAANNLASVAHLRGRPEVALGLYRSALLSYQRLGDRRGAAETWHNLGLCSRQMADLREADAAALEAVRHAELTGDPALLALTVLGRAETDLERQDLELALTEIERARRSAAESGDP
ncbi:MAG: tetratricopeptide repeat protein, partial [Planctomycetes bacterium]|nr:tetratricopeptide repeat protein [Planctomycetota bacterium]